MRGGCSREARTSRRFFTPRAAAAASRRCAVCNLTMPCLYDVRADPTEEHNVAGDHPEVVSRLAAAIAKANAGAYVSGTLDNATLARYTKLPAGHWGGFTGPCYARVS